MNIARQYSVGVHTSSAPPARKPSTHARGSVPYSHGRICTIARAPSSRRKSAAPLDCRISTSHAGTPRRIVSRSAAKRGSAATDGSGAGSSGTMAKPPRLAETSRASNARASSRFTTAIELYAKNSPWNATATRAASGAGAAGARPRM